MLLQVMLSAWFLATPATSATLRTAAPPPSPPNERPQTVAEFLRLESRPRVIAHRGASGLAPENTLAAFQKAIELGADMIELDVLLSRDGEVVVVHDDTLDRTTNAQGAVAALPLAALRRLDAGSWFDPAFAGEGIPTLGEVLELVRGKILLNIEIKTEAVTDDPRNGIAEKVIRLVNDHGLRDAVLVSSFDPRVLRHMRELDPRIATASLYNDELHAGLDPGAVMAEVGSRGFSLSKSQVTQEIVRACHALGRPVAVYTVNELATMQELIDLGVNALFTDRPDLLLELLGQR